MREVRTVGVVGAGTMGHGIAQVAAAAGLKTWLFDLTMEQARAGQQKVVASLKRAVEKGKVSAELSDKTLAHLEVTADLRQLSSCDAIIEAIPERMNLKQALFTELSDFCAEDTLLATNTSSLSVTEIAAAARSPQRVLGMHFFNPVPAMKLLELVRALQTSDETMERARQLGRVLGKELVEVNDSPGFASSRLGIILGMEAIRMVEEGVGKPADIDHSMELGYGHPMGPLRLTDLVGLDVRLAIAEYLYNELGSPAFRPPQLLKRMVRAGKLGKKTGEGFYSY